MTKKNKIKRHKRGSLTADEKRIVKALLAKGKRSQDIQYLINTGREHTINSGRITEVRKNNRIKPANEEEVNLFLANQASWDSRTNLKKFSDERLVRARDAMIMAVQVFNDPAINFKSHAFSVLAIIAWTYAMHQYFLQKKIKIKNEKTEKTLALSTMLRKSESPLRGAVKANLESIIKIRNTVEHDALGAGDSEFFMLFQACALNFDKFLCENFGEKLTLVGDLGFAIQFKEPNLEHISSIYKYHIPNTITTLSKELNEKEGMANNVEYRFRIVYTAVSSNKRQSNREFVTQDNIKEGDKISDVLVEGIYSEDQYPHKPQKVWEEVAKRTKHPFNNYQHSEAWKRQKARPKSGSAKPAQTNKKYCIYHPVYKSYTYNDAWIELLVKEIESSSDP